MWITFPVKQVNEASVLLIERQAQATKMAGIEHEAPKAEGITVTF